MTQQLINLGAAPNDGTGDTLRIGGQKINQNFAELYSSTSSTAIAIADLYTSKLNKNGDVWGGAMNAGGYRLEALGNPDSDDDALPRGYADARYLRVTSAQAIDIGNRRLEAVGNPDTDDDAANVYYVRSAISTIANGNWFRTAILNNGGFRIEAVGDPDSDDDALNLGYAKQLLAPLQAAIKSDGNNPFVFSIADVSGRVRRSGRIVPDGTFLPERWGVKAGLPNGGLTLTKTADGQLQISLGSVAGTLPIGTGGLINDVVNPNYIFAVTAADDSGRVRRSFATTKGGVTLGAVSTISAGNANGGLNISSGGPGIIKISLGTVPGTIPIGTGGALSDTGNPRYTQASTIADRAGRLRRAAGVTVDGANDAEILAARGTMPSLVARLNVTQRPDGLLLSDQFAKHRMSETRSKLGDIMAGAGTLDGARAAPYQLVINFIGNSWFDNYDFFIQRLARRLRNQMGDAGAGFVGVVRGCADFAVAGITTTGTWTTLNAASADGINVPAPHIVQMSSTEVGATMRLTQKSLQSDSAALFALNNGAIVTVAKNGGAPVNKTLNAVSTDLGFTLATGDYVDVVVVSGTPTIYGFDIRRNQTGVRINKLGASASTWPRHLAATQSVYQAGLAALGGDLCCMIESINGAASWDAAQEVTYTASMVARVRGAIPLTDIMLVSPPTTLATPLYTLADRAYALRAYAAADGKIAHLDLQPAFGANVADYGDSGHAYFTSADINHPSVKGRPLVSDALYRMIFN